MYVIIKDNQIFGGLQCGGPKTTVLWANMIGSYMAVIYDYHSYAEEGLQSILRIEPESRAYILYMEYPK